MQTGLIVFFLVLMLGLFSASLQDAAHSWLARARWRVWTIPAALTALFAGVLWGTGALQPRFLLLVALYTAGPTALVSTGAPGEERPRWPDFAAILLLWLPIEFAVGKELLPQRAWPAANLTARGVSILLALSLFLLYRRLKGMKYNLPRSSRDFANAAAGFVFVAPVLIALGLYLGFMGPFHVRDRLTAGAFGLVWIKTLLGVALPEELLFRSLVQNWLMQRFGFSNVTLLAAALIFGASHLDNPPGPLPNWRYMILATIAGFVFGKVFWKSSSILSSASVHATVNSVRHAFFL